MELINEKYCYEWISVTNLMNIPHHCHVHGIPVCFTINCHRLHPHFLGCSHHPAGDFSSVCNKDLPYAVTSCLKGERRKHSKKPIHKHVPGNKAILKLWVLLHYLWSLCISSIIKKHMLHPKAFPCYTWDFLLGVLMQKYI